MFGKMERLERELREAVSALEPDLFRPADAARLFELFSRMEKLCSGAAVRLCPRAADSGAWKTEGEPSPAWWIAKKTGTSVKSASGLLETGKRLAELPRCDEAVRQGELSGRQAEQIASAASADPASQADLLGAARTEGFSGLRQRCAKVRAAACPDERSKNEQIHRERCLRWYLDEMGAFCFQARLTPQAGAVVVAALEPYKNRAFDEAARAGRRLRHEAGMADALVAMSEDSRAEAGGSSRPDKAPGAMIHVSVDHSALVRGHTGPGEVCEVPGVGPIPVSAARQLLDDAYLSVIVTDGADIKAVCRKDRYIPAKIRTALQKRDPVCVVPGCEVRHPLQIDHIKEFSKQGPTALDNLARLCPWHHFLKTHHHYRLTGRAGNWCFRPPGPDPPAVLN